ncbi:hypothetical protein CYMTET_29179 [Cymbomonas tetramitiformis]|uniref:Uncharacterized protein n=1 Tax=Cymbomonas tetramitiformis TaxID=36881 RepID=A0AAE0FLL7_9CHLO|nr:hypothetical protein CYMTET_29179 [Cymbomonas tetramitiformis]
MDTCISGNFRTRARAGRRAELPFLSAATTGKRKVREQSEKRRAANNGQAGSALCPAAIGPGSRTAASEGDTRRGRRCQVDVRRSAPNQQLAALHTVYCSAKAG